MRYNYPVNRRKFMQKVASGVLVGATFGPTSAIPASTRASSSSSQLKTAVNHWTVRHCSLPEAVQFANAAGFDGFEFMFGWLQRYIDENSEQAVIELFNSITLQPFCATGLLQRYMHLTDEEFSNATESYRKSMEFLKKLGTTILTAHHIGREKVTNFDALWENAIKRTQDAAALAEEYNLSLAVEWLSQTDFLNTAPKAIRFVNEVNRPNVGYCLDTFHMFKARDTFNAIQTIIDGNLLFVSFHDAQPGVVPEQATDFNREIPGKGILPLREVVYRLRKAGYQGYLSAEIFRRDYREQNPSELLRQTYAGFQEVLSS